jgi:protein TonB
MFDEDDPEIIDDPVLVAQFMPTFQGKDGNYFRNYIAERVKFPEDAINNSISGKVYISFVIDKDGSVTDVEVLRGVHEVVDNAVVKVIKNSPRWEPGINEGNYVRVKYAIAIAFELQ